MTVGMDIGGARKQREREQREREQREQTTAGSKQFNGVRFRKLASEIKAKTVSWSWYPYFPNGHISLIASKGGSGKGLVCSSIAAAITTGGLWPDGGEHATKGRVLWCEAEDPPAEVIIPRLTAADAKLDDVVVMNEAEFEHLNLKAFVKDEGITGIIMSPILSFLRKLGEKNDEMQVRAALTGLQDCVANTKCAIIGLCHLNKKPDLGAIERILGAVAFTNFVRAVGLVAPEKEQEGFFRFVHAKHNMSVKGADLLYQPVHTGVGGHRSQHVRLSWSIPESNVDAETLFDRNKTNGVNIKQSPRDWLIEYLTKNGETERETVVIAGAQSDHKEAALEKAMAREPRLRSRRETFPNRAFWSVV